MFIILAAIESEEDRNIMEIICDEYLEDMIRAARSILHNKQDAEDAVQNAFLRMLNHVDKLRNPRDYQTKWYVVTAAYNAAKDLYRKKKKRDETVLLYEDTVSVDQLERYEIKNEIERKILTLSEKDQILLSYRYIYGYKHVEIGEILNLSEEAVRKAVKRAEERLEKICKEERL